MTDGEWRRSTGPTAFEVEVQRNGMALYNTQSEADAAFEGYQEIADEVRLELRDENDSSDLVPSDIDDILKAAVRDFNDTLVDDATITLLDRTMRDAVSSVSAGNAASARRLRRKNVSGAEGDLAVVVDRYADASSGAIAKLDFLPEIDAGMRGMRAFRRAQSRINPESQLDRQQVIREWEERVSSLNDHYRVKGSPESSVQAALTASYLTRLADISAVIIDSTQPYLFGVPRIAGRSNPSMAATADRARRRRRSTRRRSSVAALPTPPRSTGEGVTRLGAFAGRKTGIAGNAEGKRFDRSNHFDGIRASASTEKDGADLVKMLDELADVGLLSRDSTLDIKAIDPDAQTRLQPHP